MAGPATVAGVAGTASLAGARRLLQRTFEKKPSTPVRESRSAPVRTAQNREGGCPRVGVVSVKAPRVQGLGLGSWTGVERRNGPAPPPRSARPSLGRIVPRDARPVHAPFGPSSRQGPGQEKAR